MSKPDDGAAAESIEDVKVDRGDELDPAPPADAGDEPNPMEDDKTSDEDEGSANVDDDRPDADEDAAGSDDESDDEKDEELDGDEDSGSVDDEPKDAAPEKKDFDPNPLIPRARLNQVSAKLKSEREAHEVAKKRISELEGNAAAPEKIDAQMEAKFTEHEAAVKDGDAETASKILREISTLQTQALRAEMAADKQATKQEVRAEVELDSFIDVVTENFPQFDPDSEKFSQEIVDEVRFDSEAYEAKGLSPAEAMQRAVNNMINSGSLDVAEEAAADTKDTKPSEDKKADKRKTDVKANVDAANKQPAKNKGAGQGSESQGQQGLDILSMSDDEYAALPESKQRELRGDLN